MWLYSCYYKKGSFTSKNRDSRFEIMPMKSFYQWRQFEWHFKARLHCILILLQYLAGDLFLGSLLIHSQYATQVHICSNMNSVFSPLDNKPIHWQECITFSVFPRALIKSWAHLRGYLSQNKLITISWYGKTNIWCSLTRISQLLG